MSPVPKSLATIPHIPEDRRARKIVGRTGLGLALGIWLAAWCAPVPAAAPPPGRPVVQAYTSAEHGGVADQIWSSVEGPGGVLYFGNAQGGVLEFDGAAWRRIEVPLAARTLGTDGSGRIYVAGPQQLGFLSANGEGGFDFVSLLDLLPEGHREIGEIRSIVARRPAASRGGARPDPEMVFAGPNEVLRLAGGELSILASSSAGVFQRAFEWRGGIYVPDRRRGLLRLANDHSQTMRLELVPGSEILIDRWVRMLLPFEAETALVLTGSEGVFRLGPDGVEAVELEATDFLRQHEVTDAIRLADGGFLVGTARGGATWLDERGRLLRILDQKSGLPSASVYFVMEDRQGNLWLSTDRGIGQVPRLPLSRVIDPDAIDGTPHKSFEHLGRLWVATRTGLFHADLEDPSAPRRVPDVGGVWEFAADGEDLLVASRGGVFAVRRHPTAAGEFEAVELCAEGGVRLMRFASYPERLFVAGLWGLHVLRRQAGEWACGDRVAAVPQLLAEGAEAPDGRLILLTYDGRQAFVLSPRDEATLEEGEDPFEVTSFELPDSDSRLVPPSASRLEKLHLYTRAGWLRYSSAVDGGFPFAAVTDGDAFPAIDGAALLESDEDWLWLVDEEDFALEVATWQGGERRRVAANLIERWTDARRDSGGDFYWLTHGKGVFVWDPRVERRGLDSDRPAVRVRRVESLSDQRVVYAAGATPDSGIGLELPWERHSLRFEFAAQIYDQYGGSEYQVRLEGYNDWSAWGAETFKEYTNLAEGNYRFRVRARDRWKEVHEAEPLDFVVFPPWYRTSWAWAAYGIITLALLFGAERLYRRRYERERAINRRLREVDRLKDEFLAKTSHELRTPLYGMVGLADTLLEEPVSDLPPSLHQDLEAIVASGSRLSSLVDKILEFDSQPGSGTAFSFDLSRSNAAPSSPRTVARLRGAATAPVSVEARPCGDVGKGARILVVDDEPVNRMVLGRQLETTGFRPVAVADGPAALERLENEAFDLVLLDIMMPRMSGYEVCRAIRQRHSVEDLPVIFLTAKNRITDLVDGFSAGGNDYLVKPVGKEELRVRVGLHLELLAAHRRRGREVEEKAEQLRILQGLLSICSRCKKIHDDEKSRWVQFESYIDRHSEATFSHGLCPECANVYYDEIEKGARSS